MREYLFRGKRTDNGEWVEGIPIQTHIGTFIVYEENPHYCSQYGYMEISELVMVDPATVGQFTGLMDKHGKRIFEGDILEERIRTRPGSDGKPRWRTRKYIVNWEFAGFSLVAIGAKGKPSRLINIWPVIGNIHDDPELIKGGNKG